MSKWIAGIVVIPILLLAGVTKIARRSSVLATVAVVMMLAACGGGGGAKTHHLGGAMSLVGDSRYFDWRLDQPCSGSGGYSDMRGGAQVVVKDGGGAIIATSALGTGTGKDPVESGSSYVSRCEFPIDVSVPDTEFYSVEVSHRGEVSYSRTELEDKNWIIMPALGSRD